MDALFINIGYVLAFVFVAAIFWWVTKDTRKNRKTKETLTTRGTETQRK